MRGTARRRGTIALIASTMVFGSFVVAAVPAGAVDLPTVPRNLTATAGAKTNEIDLAWTAPTTGGPSIHYAVRMASDHGAFGAPTITGNSTPKLKTTCLGVNSCDYEIAGVNSAGTGPYTAPVTGTWSVPSAPKVSAVKAGPDANEMTVSWTPPKSLGGRPVTGYLYDVQVDSTGDWNGPFTVPGGVVKSAQLPCASSSGTGGCAYRMYAQNAVGAGPVSLPKSGSYAAPAAPVLSSVAAGPAVATATLNWTAPTNVGGLAVQYYTYTISTDGGAATTSPTHLAATPTHASVPCNATAYCTYAIRAVNAKGPGAASATKTAAYAAPKTPQSITAVVGSSNDGSGSSAITVSWLAPSDSGGSPITNYQGQECAGYCPTTASAWTTATIESLGAGSTTWTPSCAAGQITCSYRVRAVTQFGMSNWTVPAYTVPWAVSNFTATTIPSDGNITVSWTGPAESGAGLASIELLVCTTSCNTASNWTDSGVSIPTSAHSATQHCGSEVQCSYRLVETDNDGNVSAVSTGSTATAAALPTAPQNLVAQTSATTTLGAVDLTWQAPSDTGGFPVDGYTLQRSTDGGATWPTTFNLGNVTSYTDTACGASVLCTYQVASVTDVGQGPFSNTAQATGSDVPTAPQSLTASTATAGVGSVVLHWTAPSGNGGHAITSYSLQRSTDGGSTWPTTLSVGVGTSYTDTGCGARVSCTYRIAAINSIGTGPNSNNATANGADVPTAPVLTTQTATATLGGVTLSWTAADGGGNAVTDYQISVKINAGTFSAFTSVGTGTTYTDPNCDTNHQHNPPNSCTYVVRAVNSVGNGPSSNQSTATALTDFAAPSVAITSPANNSSPNTNKPAITGTAGTAQGDPSTVVVSIKQSTTLFGGSPFTKTISAGAWSVSAADYTSGLPDGAYTVSVTQTDWAGNVGSASITILIDTNPPTMTFDTPHNGDFFNNSTFDSCSPVGFCGTVGDAGSGVNYVKVSIRQGSGNYWDGSSFGSATEVFVTANCSPACGTSSTGTINWNVPFAATSFPAEGVYTAHAINADNGGNQDNTGLSRTFSIDRTNPTVAVTGPVANAIYDSAGTFDSSWPQSGCTNNHEICGTAADPTSGGVAAGVASVNVSIQASNTANTTINGKYWNGTSFGSATEAFTLATGTTSWNMLMPMTNFASGGTYIVHVVAADAAGNVNSSSTVTFFVDYNPSDTTFVATTGGSDANSGLTPALAKATVAAGVQAAQGASRSRIAVATGTYGGVALSTATHGNNKTIRGGFTGGTTWKHQAPGSSVVTVTAAGTAFSVTGDTGIVLQQLTIAGTNTSLAAGSSVYGLQALGGATVTLTRDTITAAAGVAGSGGTNNAGTATGGANGGGGTGGCDHCGSTGGGAGTTVVSGGGGGSNPGRQAGNGGANGATGSGGGAGGTGGGGGCIGYYGGCKGTHGNGGAAGAKGAAGAAGAVADSAYTTSGFASSVGNGGTGGAGTAGGGGGGGGAGGAGCDGGACVGDWLSGGAGGGGGGGGAGGTGGGAGLGGGSSFGVYSVNSTVTIDNQTTITTSAGGTGGAGGSGQTAGAGGSSGGGGNGNCTGGCAVGSRSGAGGVGGGAANAAGPNGNDGSDGGGCCNGTGGSGASGGGGGGGGSGAGGGGGAGGSSIGTLAKGTGGITSISAAQITIASGGTGGAAGIAGTSGNNGLAGATGTAVKQKTVA